MVDAVSSALGLGSSVDGKLMNCGDFVHECLKADSQYCGIANP
jgi:hypothetical protein